MEGLGVAGRHEPYHYGSHYSNSGIVLHFLVRLPPFTGMFLQYQGVHSVIFLYPYDLVSVLKFQSNVLVVLIPNR